MDPVTLAITSALASLSTKEIKRGYTTLKEVLQHKFGDQSELLQAIERLEQKPDSMSRQAMLQEAVIHAKANQEHDVLRVTEILINQLKAHPDSNIQIAGDQDINIHGDNIAGDATAGAEPTGPGDGRPK